MSALKRIRQTRFYLIVGFMVTHVGGVEYGKQCTTRATDFKREEKKSAIMFFFFFTFENYFSS